MGCVVSLHDYGTEHESVTVPVSLSLQEFTQEIAQKNVEAVRMVQDKLTLIRVWGTSDK